MIKLFTDSDTDITLQECEKYGYTLISMPYIIDNKITYPYKDFKVFEPKPFYDMLRKGTIPTTCTLNPEEYKDYFKPVFENGDDILYVSFSTSMSGTFNSLNIAVEELKEEYPDRKFYQIDTKDITIGSNIIVKEIGDMHLKGASIDEIMKWAEKEVDKFACYFYADDLKFFKHSGRVSGLAATMGSILLIKPIIYIGDDGKMTNVGKERGRNKAVNRLLNYVMDLQDNIKNHHIVIGHSDALELAHQLGEMLKQKFGEDLVIDYVAVNPTAGSHCGPDAIGISFHAIHR